MKRSAVAVTLVTLVFSLVSVTGAAAASRSDDLDPRIVYALKAEPGGVVIGEHQVYWPHLEMTLTLPEYGPRGLSTQCPVGTICAFLLTNEGGTRLTWGACGTYPTTALPTVGSVASARPTGSVQARNGTTVVATASAGNFVNVFAATNNVRCIA